MQHSRGWSSLKSCEASPPQQPSPHAVGAAGARHQRLTATQIPPSSSSPPSADLLPTPTPPSSATCIHFLTALHRIAPQDGFNSCQSGGRAGSLGSQPQPRFDAGCPPVPQGDDGGMQGLPTVPPQGGPDDLAGACRGGHGRHCVAGIRVLEARTSYSSQLKVCSIH